MRDKLDNTEISIMNNIDTFFRSMIDRASLYAYEEGDDIPFDKMKELNGIDFTKTDAAVVYKFLKENSASIVNVISYDESNHIPLNTSAYNRRLCKEAVYKMNDYVKALDNLTVKAPDSAVSAALENERYDALKEAGIDKDDYVKGINVKSIEETQNEIKYFLSSLGDTVMIAQSNIDFSKKYLEKIGCEDIINGRNVIDFTKLLKEYLQYLSMK